MISQNTPSDCLFSMYVFTLHLHISQFLSVLLACTIHRGHHFNFYFSWIRGGSSTQAWMPTYVSILRVPQMIWVWRATVEWYWQGKTEEPGEKPVPVPLCPPQMPHGLTQARTRASAVRGRLLTTWAMARPTILTYVNSLLLHIKEVQYYYYCYTWRY
jgi:hypothetical protein